MKKEKLHATGKDAKTIAKIFWKLNSSTNARELFINFRPFRVRFK